MEDARVAHGWLLPLHLALDEVRSHAMRSTVTAAAVFMGVATLLVLTSLSRGMQEQNQEMYLRMGGAQILQVTAAKSLDAFQDASFARSRGLRLSDVDALRDRLAAFDAWVPEIDLDRGAITLRGKRMMAHGTASTWERFDVLGIEIDTAVDFSESRWESGEALAVVGINVLERMGGRAGGLGKEILINGRSVRVAAVFKSSGKMDWRNRDVAIPITWYNRIMGESDPVLGTLRARVANIDEVQHATTDLKNELVALHRGVADVDVSDNSDLLENSQKTIKTMAVLTWLIAAVSLLSGGIGILNVQLSSLAARIRELGTSRALGAPARLVFRQVLLESILVAAGGGIAGTVVGLAPGMIPSGVLPWNLSLAWTDLAVATALAFGVGVASGIVPAMRAKRLDPVEAMRA